MVLYGNKVRHDVHHIVIKLTFVMSFHHDVHHHDVSWRSSNKTLLLLRAAACYRRLSGRLSGIVSGTVSGSLSHTSSLFREMNDASE